MPTRSAERWVVVGAGSGGCVAARRLFDAGYDVVLVEGGPPLPDGGVPAEIDGDDAFSALSLADRVEAGLVARRTAEGEITPYLRGSGVGGSSAVNMMLARRGSADRYDAWNWDRGEVDAAWDRVLIPEERPRPDELGRIDRMLRIAVDDAEVSALTRRSGRRVTSAEAYLWPMVAGSAGSSGSASPGSSSSGRHGFEIVSNSTVDRVITDASNAATGVQLCDRTHIHADAVVLAAGAIHTPAILQRSGVSDAGRGLVDHPAVGFLLELRDDDAAVPGPGGGLGLVSSVIVERAGVQVLAINHLGPASPHQHAMLLVAVMDPVSPGGRVAVRSDDPAVAPDVDFALLSDKGDLERLATGVEFVRELLRTPPFADAVDRTYVDDVGTTIDELDSDDVIDRWMRTRGADYVHAACSSSTVVDEVGRVIGVDGLFVCDASAFPAIPDANTHLPTTMLAERFCAHWVDPRRA